MEPLSLTKIAEALQTEISCEKTITSICTDTREIREGSLFFAIKGERFDGHDFTEKAFELGASAAVVHKDVSAPGPLLRVDDTRKALLALSGWYRRLFRTKVVSVTGSVGKTSTKEMIDTVLSSAFRTLKTEGNLNNEIGLPKTLFRLDAGYEAAVIEMGMSGFGEISRLSKAAGGDIGVITNIGVSHIEKLGSREGIFRAKMEILDGLREGAPLIVNGDDDLLGTVSLQDRPVLRYGVRRKDLAARAEEIRTESGGTGFFILYQKNRYPAFVPALGTHHVYNALAAFLAGVTLGIAPEAAAEALKGYQPSGMRQRIVEHNGVTVIEDCYNASPDSMEASLSVLSMAGGSGKKIAVLGDMLELGAYAEEGHRRAGRAAANNGADAVLCLGENARFIAEEARGGGVPFAELFDRREDAVRWLKDHVGPGDTVLFKASRGMRLEELISAYYGEE